MWIGRPLTHNFLLWSLAHDPHFIWVNFDFLSLPPFWAPLSHCRILKWPQTLYTFSYLVILHWLFQKHYQSTLYWQFKNTEIALLPNSGTGPCQGAPKRKYFSNLVGIMFVCNGPGIHLVTFSLEGHHFLSYRNHFIPWTIPGYGHIKYKVTEL